MNNQTIILRMSNNCNLNCTYCYDKKNDIKENINFKNNINAIVRNLSILNKNKECIQKIILHGGEPLMIPLDIYEIFLKKLNTEIPRNKLSIQTNATLITDRHAKLFKKYKIRVGISLDGCNEKQNSCRVYKNGKGTLERVLKSIDILKKWNVKFGLIITISRNHIGQEDELYNFVKEHNLNCTIRPAFPINNFDNKLILSSEEYFEFFKNIFNIWYNDRTNKVKFNQIIDIADEFLKVLNTNYRVNCCSDSKNCFKNFISLDINGNLYSCNRTYGIPEFYYGNINAEPIQDIYAKMKELGEKREKAIENSKCKECELYKYCYGGCPATAYNIDDSLLLPEEYICDAKLKIRKYILNKLEKNGDLERYRRHKSEI